MPSRRFAVKSRSLQRYDCRPHRIHLPPANPAEGLAWFRRVRMLGILDEKLRVGLFASIAEALDRLILQQFLAVAHAPKWHLPRRDVLDIVLLRHNRPAGLEHQ